MNTDINYRPKSLDDFVFANQQLKQKIDQYVIHKCRRPLVLYGPHGSGKAC